MGGLIKAVQLIYLGNVMNPPLCQTFWELEVEVVGCLGSNVAGRVLKVIINVCQAARRCSPNYASSEDTITRVA